MSLSSAARLWEPSCPATMGHSSCKALYALTLWASRNSWQTTRFEEGGGEGGAQGLEREGGEGRGTRFGEGGRSE